MKGSKFIEELAIKLRDPGHRQWSQIHATEALNSALRALTKVKPRVYTLNESLPLVDGHEQTIPGDVNELISILYTLDPNSASGVGEAVILGDMGMMDHDHPSWRNDPAKASPKYWFYEPDKHEHVFYVWPPVAGEGEEGGAVVQATVSRTPVMSEHTSEEINNSTVLSAEEFYHIPIDDEIPIQEFYVDALYEWALYYATSRDDEATSNYARSKDHFTKFFALLDAKMNADMAVRKVRELVE